MIAKLCAEAVVSGLEQDDLAGELTCGASGGSQTCVDPGGSQQAARPSRRVYHWQWTGERSRLRRRDDPDKEPRPLRCRTLQVAFDVEFRVYSDAY